MPDLIGIAACLLLPAYAAAVVFTVAWLAGHKPTE